MYKGVYTKDKESVKVAIKTLRGKHRCQFNYYAWCIHVVVDTSKTEQFIKECIIAKQFIHSNVLSLIGVSYIKGEAIPLMILPFMHNGDVTSFVKSKRGNVLEVTEFPEVPS